MNLDDVYNYSLTFYAMPYQWGGSGTSKGDWGIDCSGLVNAILKFSGVPLPRRLASFELYEHFKDCPQSKERGALVFFGANKRVSHVGWMIDQFQMISAAGGSPECTTALTAKAMGASVKTQPVAWYRRYEYFGAFLPPYPFLVPAT